MRYKVIVNGYGAQVHIRRINKELYDFWTQQDPEATRSHLFEDSYSDLNGNPIWDDHNPLFLGMAKSKRDRMIEVFGPRPSHIHVHVFDEDEQPVFATSTIKEVPRFTMNCEELGKGYYLKGVRETKGTFFTGFLHEDEFNQHLLNLALVSIDGDKLLYRVEYGHKTLENEREDTGIVKETFNFYNNT